MIDTTEFATAVDEFNAGFAAHNNNVKYEDTPLHMPFDEWRIGWAWAAFNGLRMDIARKNEALRILAKYNRIRNDSDSYLIEVTRWGLGEIDEFPIAEDYGQE